ncbi:hypothetical protein F441_14218 [Phytophthora nicotianae CJ01A1]|uniref:Uncharacterized protein n=8 Tax=Phytophthora nicotianae TaxID=4792 RepID=W2PWZ7_PHYN3|nr:hypothetical protein PPTG_14407 [Phytophthora nicotianae INRA-310]ETI40207.1 hypothetical protein F443_14338 [Phytophthora nicotianae P1569]ETL33735.1 hypothetical protein L916_13878 [Phytophthora nicotianae]ETO68908.1 hypothetical protein F444_14342 [Phytophthora nicotianae P1976]ETP10058.1 hypothetical protein F441_14218 [Phytophthora nicotianae CJ01A1]KUF87059.1 hypothetical protein AM587_10008235 [Phytophthora nicotianae]
MDTPPSIRRQYASPPRESPEGRRRRLANRRAAKYRHFKSLSSASHPLVELQRQQSTRRQRERRLLLDDEARDRLRAQNRRRQQLRRQNLSDRAKADIRQKQRERQRERRHTLNDEAREELRARERLRIRCRRRQLKRQHEVDEEDTLLPAQLQLLQPVLDRDRLPHLRLAPELPTLRQHQEQQRQREMQNRLPFGGGVQITLPPPPPIERVRTYQHERIPSLPHLQQVTRPTTSSLLHTTPPPPLFSIPGPGSATSAGLPTVASAVAAAATRPPHPTPIMPSVSLPLPNKPLAALPLVQQQQQPPRTPIVLPPAHRSLPPLPDFLNSREAFNPATAAAATSTRASRPSSTASRALFPSITDLPATHTDVQDADSYFQR